TTIHTPGTPDAVAVGQGAVWVTSVLNRTSRIDPGTNRVADTTEFGLTPIGVAVDPSNGAAWVASQGCFTCPGADQPATVVRIDPATDQASPPLVVRPDFPGYGIAFGRGLVWAAVGSVVFQIDPSTAAVVRRIQVGGQLGSIDVDDRTGSVWITN